MSFQTTFSRDGVHSTPTRTIEDAQARAVGVTMDFFRFWLGVVRSEVVGFSEAGSPESGRVCDDIEYIETNKHNLAKPAQR